MRVVFLGTGTSVGVPVIGCVCPVCRSDDPRNRRLRASVWLRTAGVSLVIDMPPDFRSQALAYGIDRVDAVLFTHAHADHIMGLDDIRRFNTMQGAVIPAYGDAATIAAVRRTFPYIGQRRVEGCYRPLVDFQAVDGPFRLGDVRIVPLAVRHGSDTILGFRCEHGQRAFGYVPDCSAMDAASIEGFRGVDLMVLDGLRHTPHGSHMTVAESVRLLQRIGAPRSLLTHIGHDIDHGLTEAELPPGIGIAHDGRVDSLNGR